MAGTTFRSAITGHYVTPEFAAEHPDTTIAEDNITSDFSECLTSLADRIDAVRNWVADRPYILDGRVMSVPVSDMVMMLDMIDPEWRAVTQEAIAAEEPVE